MKVVRCQGEGQGSCRRCTENGIWNSAWMTFLYKIEGIESVFCSKCVKEIQEEK